MKIQATVPASFEVLAASEADLTLTTNFSLRGCNVVTTVLVGDVAPNLGDEGGVRAEAHAIRLELTDAGAGVLDNLLEHGDREALLKLIIKAANRVIGAIRNFGTTPHLDQVRNVFDADLDLRRLEVRIANDSTEWTDLVPAPDSLEGMLLERILFSRVQRGKFSASDWRKVEEAIQDELPPPPEQEFLVNALEHVAARNYRLAVVEAVFCLEVVLTRFLRAHFGIERAIPKEQFEHLLTPQVGLTARVAALLDLTSANDVLEHIDRKAILRVIKWRNRIAHETGHLPQGISGAEIAPALDEVFELSRGLSIRERLITYSPEAKRIGKEVAAALQLKGLTVQRRADHRVSVDWNSYPDTHSGSEEKIVRDIVRVLTPPLRGVDARFDPQIHLEIRVRRLFTPVGMWRAGTWAPAKGDS
jgi:hypothetical protein